ncbi:hypothetical protein FG877_02145 [Enterococcus casseliflavus]|nr:hypothetical protein [Enterococcus casseliflavus]
MNNKKLNKLVVLSATLTLGVSPLLDNAIPILNNNIIAKAEEVAKAVEINVKAGEANDSVLYIDTLNDEILANQKYEISAVGNGQIEFYHDRNISETNDVWSIKNGDGTEAKVRTFLNDDVIRIKANKGTDLKVIFTPITLDLTKLKSLNEQAKKLLSEDENKYVLETRQKLISANRDAEYWLKNTQHLTQKELKTAEDTLENAINNLTKLVDVVNRDTLEDLINKAKNIDKDKYTELSVKDLNTALTNAIKVNDDETSDQNAINEVASKLKKALDNLEEKAVSKYHLSELIISAPSSYQKDKYTDVSWKNFEDALNDAEKVFSDDKATQAEVDTAEKALSDAIDNLKKKDGSEEPGNEDKKILVGNTITLKDSYLNYYAVYYDYRKDELSFKASDLTILGIEQPKPLENINLNGKKTFVVNGEKWELVDNKNGTYNLKYVDNYAIRFNSLDEYADLVENYSLFHYIGNKIERITNADLDFDVDYIDLNTKEGQEFNNNQVPNLNFEFDDTYFNFNFEFDETNKLANHSFKYTYDLSNEFINSDVYKEFEGKEQYNGYIKRNVINSGGYQAYVMQYQLKEGKLIINVLNTASAEPLKYGRPVENFQGEGKLEVEIPIIPEKPEEKEELPAFKPTIRPIKEKIIETKQPIVKEEVPKMGVGPTFMGVPIIGVGVGGLAIALALLIKRKFPIISKADEDKDTEE